MDIIKQQRGWLKSKFGKYEDIKSDQQLGLPQPPLMKSYDNDSEKVKLPDVNKNILTNINIFDVFEKRTSKRKFSNEYMTLEELSFLLWATQGVKKVLEKKISEKNIATLTLRTVPSGGARHPFETYIAVNKVEGLKNGLYRYLPLTHELIFMYEIDNLQQKLSQYASGQKFIEKSAVTFIWSVVPYRSEWRYSIRAHKVMMLDAGHICQNLYLACEAIGCGTCAIASYKQEKMDELLSLDGKDEFVIYLAPVGKCE